MTPDLQRPTKPEGYYHGVEHGLALAQTTRRSSQNREGWVDITLNLVAVKFGGSELSVQGEGTNSVCFGGGDCFFVKWGSKEQNEAELTGIGGRGGIFMDELDGHPAQKAVNLGVTFQVAANATKASLFFGEHRVPLDLDGDYAPRDEHLDSLPVPTPSPAQDAKTAGFFVDSEHGIAVTGVSRTGDIDERDGDNNPLMSVARVDLYAGSPSRRRYPELVTTAPDADDEEVFGDAWPLVKEWRGLWDGHPGPGQGLGVGVQAGADSGAGGCLAGGPRPDPAAGDGATAGPGPGSAVELASEGAPRVQEAAGQAGIPAPAAAGVVAGALAEVAPRRHRWAGNAWPKCSRPPRRVTFVRVVYTPISGDVVPGCRMEE